MGFLGIADAVIHAHMSGVRSFVNPNSISITLHHNTEIFHMVIEKEGGEHMFY